MAHSSRFATLAAMVTLVASVGPPPSVRGQATSFPFTILDGRFHHGGTPVFLNIIGYQPLEPGQAVTGEIRSARIQDDLRRFRAYRDGADPVALRVYAQPTPEFPNRMPKSFYDGVRDLGFWVVRDIYYGSRARAGGEPHPIDAHHGAP